MPISSLIRAGVNAGLFSAALGGGAKVLGHINRGGTLKTLNKRELARDMMAFGMMGTAGGAAGYAGGRLAYKAVRPMYASYSTFAKSSVAASAILGSHYGGFGLGARAAMNPAINLANKVVESRRLAKAERYIGGKADQAGRKARDVKTAVERAIATKRKKYGRSMRGKGPAQPGPGFVQPQRAGFDPSKNTRFDPKRGFVNV